MTQPEALRLADHLEREYYVPAAYELRRLHQHELANNVWHEKTEWVQETVQPNELGKHRADVLRERLIKATAQRDELLEALQLIADVGDRAATEISRAAIAKTEGKT